MRTRSVFGGSGSTLSGGRSASPSKTIFPTLSSVAGVATFFRFLSMMTASALFLVMGTFGSWALAVNNRSVEVGAEDGFQ